MIHYEPPRDFGSVPPTPGGVWQARQDHYGIPPIPPYRIAGGGGAMLILEPRIDVEDLIVDPRSLTD